MSLDREKSLTELFKEYKDNEDIQALKELYELTKEISSEKGEGQESKQNKLKALTPSIVNKIVSLAMLSDCFKDEKIEKGQKGFVSASSEKSFTVIAAGINQEIVNVQKGKVIEDEKEFKKNISAAISLLLNAKNLVEKKDAIKNERGASVENQTILHHINNIENDFKSRLDISEVCKFYYNQIKDKKMNTQDLNYVAEMIKLQFGEFIHKAGDISNEKKEKFEIFFKTIDDYLKRGKDKLDNEDISRFIEIVNKATGLANSLKEYSVELDFTNRAWPFKFNPVTVSRSISMSQPPSMVTAMSNSLEQRPARTSSSPPNSQPPNRPPPPVPAAVPKEPNLQSQSVSAPVTRSGSGATKNPFAASKPALPTGSLPTRGGKPGSVSGELRKVRLATSQELAREAVAFQKNKTRIADTPSREIKNDKTNADPQDTHESPKPGK